MNNYKEIAEGIYNPVRKDNLGGYVLLVLILAFFLVVHYGIVMPYLDRISNEIIAVPRSYK